MRISVFYDHITQALQRGGRSLEQLLGLCRSFGIDGLEIRYTQLEEGGAALRGAIARAGLAVSCIYEFYDFPHSADLGRAKGQIDMAAETGAGRVLVVPGFLEEREAAFLAACRAERGAAARFMESHASTCGVRDALRELTAYGGEKGVKVTLEDFDSDASPCAGMWPLKWLLEQVPGLGFTLDMGNFAYCDEDVVQGYGLLREYIVHVHCKDRGLEPGRRGRFCQGLACVPVGDGYLPVGELTGRLLADGYDGYFAIEHFDAPDQLDYMRRSAAFLRGMAR